jgi:hypothetical protein
MINAYANNALLFLQDGKKAIDMAKDDSIRAVFAEFSGKKFLKMYLPVRVCFVFYFYFLFVA